MSRVKLADLEFAKEQNLQTWLSSEHWRERVISFNASWFVLTMGTGATFEVLLNFPYTATWLRNLAYCFWVLDMALFLFFLAISTVRLFMFPNLTKEIYLDFSQTSYLGAIPITLGTIIVGITEFYHDRAAAVWAAWALWWIALCMSLCVGSLVVVFVCAYQDPHELESVTGVWLLSFIPFIVTSGAGALLVLYLPTVPATVCLVVSYLSWALGVLMAHLILAIYMHRLIACSLPAREAIISCFIPMGPAGMGAYAIQLLATSFSSVLRRTNFTFNLPAAGDASGTLDTMAIHTIAEAIHWTGVLMGLALVAEATFWLIFAFTALGVRIPRHFNVGFWAFVFPTGVYANALIQLSTNLRNNGFKGYAATMGMLNIVLWCICAAFTVFKCVWHAQLTFAPGLEGWNERVALRKMRSRRSLDVGSKQRETRSNDSSRLGRGRSIGQTPRTSDGEMSVSAAEMLDGGFGGPSDQPDTVARVSRPDGSYSLARWRRRVLPI